MRILVVDDEQDVREIIVEILQDAGYDVVQANNGWSGLSKLEEVACDLLWTDLTMRGLGGIELATRVRAKRPNFPILLCSAQLPDYIDPMLFNAVLSKPVHLAEILTTVGKLLNH